MAFKLMMILDTVKCLLEITCRQHDLLFVCFYWQNVNVLSRIKKNKRKEKRKKKNYSFKDLFIKQKNEYGVDCVCLFSFSLLIINNNLLIFHNTTNAEKTQGKDVCEHKQVYMAL